MHVLLRLFAIRNVEISNYFHISGVIMHQNAPERSYLNYSLISPFSIKMGKMLEADWRAFFFSKA